MTDSKKLFYQAKGINPSITVLAIVAELKRKGVKVREFRKKDLSAMQTVSKHMVYNMLAGISYYQEVEDLLKEIIAKG